MQTTIQNKVAAIDNCFIDGTLHPISRPVVNQRVVYNRHKWVYALKFQSVSLPNGLIGHLYGHVGENLLYIDHLITTIQFWIIAKCTDHFDWLIDFILIKGGMQECWQSTISMIIWRILLLVLPEGKCVYTGTHAALPTHDPPPSPILSWHVKQANEEF